MSNPSVQPFAPEWAIAAAARPLTDPGQPPTPDLDQVTAFFKALFPVRNGETVHMRAVAEPRDGRPQHNAHYALDEHFDTNAQGFVTWCALDGRAAFVLPGLVRGNGTKAEDVISLPAILCDFDKLDVAANFAAAEAMLGPATVVVESGGVTEAGQPKLHAHWALKDAAIGGDIALACAVREELAKRFGGDLSFKQAGQVARIGGGLHLKRGPALSKVTSIRDVSYSLSVIACKLKIAEAASEKSNVLPFSLDFSRDTPARTTADLRDMYVQTEGKSEVSRWEWFNLVAGAEIADVRAGRKTQDEALQYVIGKILTHFECPEDWDVDRATREFNALVRVDLRNHGPVVPVQPAIPQGATGLQLTDWYARDKFKGVAPERKWLVDGLIPRGTPGVFAAVGDAGKSMLALRLANMVASYPPPETTTTSPAGITDAPRFFGQPVVGRGTAVFLTGEDDADEVHRRLDAIDPSGAWRAPQSRLIVLPLLSAGGAHALIASGPRGPEFTPAWHELRAQLEALPDLALVVLDPLTLFVGGDTNDNSMGAALMGEINRLASQTGAAVMLIHHFAKTASTKIVNLSDARNAVLGAAAWVNNARWSLVLWEADQDGAYKALKALGRVHQARQAGVVYYGGLTKGNAPGAKVMRTLVRGGAGVLEDRTEQLEALAPSRGDVDGALFGELCALKRQDPTFAFTQSPSALMEAWGPALRKLDLPITKDGKGKGKHPIATVFDRLLDSGKLVKTEDRSTKPRYEPVLP